MLIHHTIKLALVAALASAACSSDSGSEAAPDAQPPAPDAAAVDTWDSFALGFFTTYCHACHGPGDALRDYSLQPTVQGEQNSILCGVSPVSVQGCGIPAKQFPVGGGPKPSDAERTRLVDWIEAGAL